MASADRANIDHATNDQKHPVAMIVKEGNADFFSRAIFDINTKTLQIPQITLGIP